MISRPTHYSIVIEYSIYSRMIEATPRVERMRRVDHFRIRRFSRSGRIRAT